MDLLQASRSQLVNEVYESKKMLYRLINLPTDVKSNISNSLLPYLSMLCDGIDNLFQTEDSSVLSNHFEDINDKSFTTLVKKVRVSSKLLTDKKNIRAAMKMLDGETRKFHDDLIKDYNEQQLSFIKVFGQADLGIFYYENRPYANSSQINLYIHPFNSSLREVGNDVFKFSKQIATYINSFCSGLEGHVVPQLNRDDYIIKVDRENFHSQDFIYSEEDKRNIFNKAIDKDVSLYLLNMQCQLNFALNLLNLLIAEHPLKYRIQLLVYYYSVQAIDYAYRSGYLQELEECQEMIVEVIQAHKEIFSSDAFRNNLFHYKLSQEITPSMNKNSFEIMVETLTFMSLEDLLIVVYKEMETAEKLIKKIIY